MKFTRERVRALSEQDLADLRGLVTREYARRQRIHKRNAEWTAGKGLEDCLGVSVERIQVEKEMLRAVEYSRANKSNIWVPHTLARERCLRQWCTRMYQSSSGDFEEVMEYHGPVEEHERPRIGGLEWCVTLCRNPKTYASALTTFESLMKGETP